MFTQKQINIAFVIIYVAVATLRVLVLGWM